MIDSDERQKDQACFSLLRIFQLDYSDHRHVHLGMPIAPYLTQGD